MRILIYGINYAPELTGIGKYTSEMAEWFAKEGHDVSVITAMPYYPEWQVHKKYKNKLWYKDTINNVKIYRNPLYVPMGVDSKRRIIHELSFLCSSSYRWFAILFKKKFDLIINICPPFHIGIAPYIYSKFRKTIFVTHIQDLQIDAAKDLKMISNKQILNFMFKLENFLFRNSHFVSTLTLGMHKKVESKGIPRNKIIMLPNWVDLSFIRPLPKEESLRSRFNLPYDATIILYSGNMGKKQGLDLLLIIAKEYLNHKDIHFVMVGAGAEKNTLKNMSKEMKLTNLHFFPLQPYEDLPALLATADIHLILQKKEASDLVMPSKLTGILAAGGVAIVTAPEGTSLYNDILNNNIGIVCDPESKQALKNAIDKALNIDLSTIKRNARLYAETNLDKKMILTTFLKKVM